MSSDKNSKESVKPIKSQQHQDTTCNSFWKPNGKNHRFLVLLFMCWLGFGPYFCYDNPSALQDNIINDINITATQFSLLYSLYSWPPVVVCIIGGVLIDSVLGIRIGAMVYMGIALVGQFIFAVGALLNVFWIMALGRLVFGVGAEPLAVVQSNYAVAWFKGKELNMVFGLLESCSGLGSVLNYWIMDSLYSWMGNFYDGHQLLGIVLLMANVTCVFSMICSVILNFIQKRAEEVTFTQDNTSSTRGITFTDVKNFHWSFWLLNVVVVTYYVAIYPFFALSKMFFMSNFNMTPTSANRLNSLLYLVSVFGAPPLGFIIDKVGKNVFWIMIAIICTLAGHSVLAFFSWSPYIGVVLISVSASIITSVFYPIVALVIPENQLGTAYGLCWSIQNLFISIAAILAGIIVDYVGYIWLEIFFIASLTVSFIGTVFLLALNDAHNGILNLTPSQREVYSQNVNQGENILRTSPSTISEEALCHTEGDTAISNKHLPIN